MNRSTFWMIKYMNGSVFSKARYMNGVGFEILARTPVPVQIQISWSLQKPTDLDLHCLQSQDISGFSRTRIKNFFT